MADLFPRRTASYFLAYTTNGDCDHVLLVEQDHGTPDELVTTRLRVISEWQVDDDLPEWTLRRVQLRDYLEETGRTVLEWYWRGHTEDDHGNPTKYSIADYGELLAITTERGTYLPTTSNLTPNLQFRDLVEHRLGNLDLYNDWAIQAAAPLSPAREEILRLSYRSSPSWRPREGGVRKGKPTRAVWSKFFREATPDRKRRAAEWLRGFTQEKKFEMPDRWRASEPLLEMTPQLEAVVARGEILDLISTVEDALSFLQGYIDAGAGLKEIRGFLKRLPTTTTEELSKLNPMLKHRRRGR